MQEIERIYKIDQLLHARGVVPTQTFLAELEVSLATLKRDLAYMRDRLNAPIVFDRERGGYKFAASGKGPRYELPGLWFNEAEAAALVTMAELLSGLDGGLIGPHIQPLRARIDAILGNGEVDSRELKKRIRITSPGARRGNNAFFPAIGHALMRRKRLHIHYYARGTDETTERTVSPQRLIFYRQNWYLDAWCHVRQGLRSFALDGILQLDTLEDSAEDFDESELDNFFSGGYGIFSGSKVHWAKLRFSAARAKWVAAERWHSQQRGNLQKDGSYLLEVPYSDPRELMGDILRHGAEVDVLEPAELRAAIAAEWQRALARMAESDAFKG
ncbi:MAG: WYL domain-containing protein [Betaproteobacteria bacterium]|nr:WYL domain-containing protein [Betaproteobacteria bacterium]